jgi:hypothetical protein
MLRNSLLLLGFFLIAPSLPAAACSLPPPVRVRTSNPTDGDTNVPTSIRVRVSYATGADGEGPCGPKPTAPILRFATTPLDAGFGDAGVPVDGGTDIPGMWIMATDVDPHVSTDWEFRPMSPLPANTDFELVDPWPQSCDCTIGCKPIPPAVFARFTTGNGPDTTNPTFGGLVGTSCSHDICGTTDTTCCGPYDHWDYTFVGKGNESDDHLVGVHLYVRPDKGSYDFTKPVGPLKLTDPVDSIVANAWSMTLAPGKYFVIARAFDSSGNEDSNMVETSFVFPLKNDPLCADLPTDDGGVDMTYVPADLSGTAQDDLATAPPATPTGCSCSVGGRASRPVYCIAAIVILLLALGRSRRGARGGRS